ncbi:MAG: hypothetical protein M0023_07525 [Desulfobacteraceae bacterium]|nr:hypothetical protein [Desulfobacteraceae bacterium]
MKKIVAITPTDADNGFGCSGAIQFAAQPGEVLQSVKRAMADPETGVLILDERLAAEIDEKQLQDLELHWSGVLVMLPSPDQGRVEEDYAARLLRRAIGYQVRVRQ